MPEFPWVLSASQHASRRGNRLIQRPEDLFPLKNYKKADKWRRWGNLEAQGLSVEEPAWGPMQKSLLWKYDLHHF